MCRTAKNGFKPKVVDFADLDLATLPKAGKVIAIAATWGEGEPPARAADRIVTLEAGPAGSTAWVATFLFRSTPRRARLGWTCAHCWRRTPSWSRGRPC